jgi:hypothetical protein
MSFLTSLYVAKIHWPYAEACVAHVVVEWRAKRRNGVVAVGTVAACITVTMRRWCKYLFIYLHNLTSTKVDNLNHILSLTSHAATLASYNAGLSPTSNLY